MNVPDKHYAFFQNTKCEYFPCHKTDKPDQFNCLFCYCPLYALGKNCPGSYSYNEEGIKDCSDCLFPHVKGNYDRVLERFHDLAELARDDSRSE